MVLLSLSLFGFLILVSEICVESASIESINVEPSTAESKNEIQEPSGNLNFLDPRNAGVFYSCRNTPQFILFSDPIDSSKYIYCILGKQFSGVCPNGMHFNGRKRLCEKIEDVPVPTCNSGKVVAPAPEPSSVSSTTSSSIVPTDLEMMPPPPPLVAPLIIQSTPEPEIEFPMKLTEEVEELEDIDQIEITTTTTTFTIIIKPKPPLLKDEFEFQLDCKSKHPCGLYPNTDGDCTTFFLCGNNGSQITKHCNGGQLFDTKELECKEPMDALCWEEPDSGPYPRSALTLQTCPFHDKPNAQSYQNASEGIILSNPVVTNWGSWQSWELCPKDTYVTGINAWRRLLQSGQNHDQAGIVSLSLNCESPDGIVKTFIESLAPGVPNDGWPSYYTCNGAGIGFRLNSQQDQGPNDNVATDNVQIICSCGPPVYKPYELIPGLQSGNRGDWTQEQICKPRQALCGMQTQMVDYRERVIGSYDNTGLNNMNMKCCDVPNPALTCNPTEEFILLRTCENSQGIYPRRCEFKVSIGIQYDFQDQYLHSINFHESVGYSLENVMENLKNNFAQKYVYENIQEYEYDWKDTDDVVWNAMKSNSSSRAIYLEPDTKVELYQIIGICSYFNVRTNWFIKNVTDLNTGETVEEYFQL